MVRKGIAGLFIIKMVSGSLIWVCLVVFSVVTKRAKQQVFVQQEPRRAAEYGKYAQLARDTYGEAEKHQR